MYILKDYKTEQEAFWAGDFGSEYTQRNTGSKKVAANIALFTKIFRLTENVSSVLEFGSNIGLNLQAVRAILPQVEMSAIEINLAAVAELRKWGMDTVRIYPQSILDFKPDYPRDFVFSKGLLIHLDPDSLPLVYQSMYDSSKRYLALAEYYNPDPVSVRYRGNDNRLFKRDFAGEIMDRYPDMRLLDYGFTYRRDANFPQDDLTWFMLEKRP
jgi:pseudaminic acid biosynthesis-associated methylase